MEKTSDRETRDFMSVESFSQLPFIRSTPPAEEKLQGGEGGGGGGGGAIRLFGKEFGSNRANTDDDDDDDYPLSDEDNNNNNAHEEEGDANIKESSSESSSSRKFECHYCCRNFPTSQALGGHQNAHKRERQQAKRAHLQSAMLHANPHVYGLINNYARLPSAPVPLPHMAYPSWSPSTRTIYGSSFTPHPQPINGSPLAFWRLPSAQTSVAYRPSPPLMFGPKNELKPLPSSISNISSSQFRFGYESKPEMQEHVSLDLHL